MLIATNGRGDAVREPSTSAIETMLGKLRRGDEHLILEWQDEGREGDWYVQVWFRDDNTYQLEYRDGVPAEHYQTRTVSREKVRQALLGWVAGTTGWREEFVWDNIGHWFTPDAEDEDEDEGDPSGSSL